MMIRNKLRAILLVLFALIVGLVALNFYTFEKLEGDAPAINASGSLRMRAYQLAWLSARLVSADEAEAPHIRTAMLMASFREVAGKEADLTQQLRAARYDEIGRIVHSFNSFVSDLRRSMQRAKECSAEVSGLSDAVWQASVENSKAVECNAVAITNVAAHTSEQDENIQMIAVSVNGISEHLAEIQERMKEDAGNRSTLFTSLEAARACAQAAAAAAESVARTSREIAGLTEDSAAAIEEETASLEAFAATAEHLKGLAGELDTLVGRFKV